GGGARGVRGRARGDGRRGGEPGPRRRVAGDSRAVGDAEVPERRGGDDGDLAPAGAGAVDGVGDEPPRRVAREAWVRRRQDRNLHDATSRTSSASSSTRARRERRSRTSGASGTPSSPRFQPAGSSTRAPPRASTPSTATT